MSAVAPPFSSLQHHGLHRSIQVEKPINSKAKLPDSTPQNSQFSLPQQINSLCQSNDLNKALKLLQQEAKNVERSSSDMVSALGLLLQASGHQKETEIGRKAHELVSDFTPFKDDIFLNTSVITMYSNCGFPLDSRIVFDQSRVKDLCLWNAIVSAYVRNELWFDALLVFCELLIACESYSRDGDVCQTFNILQNMQVKSSLGANEVTILNLLPVCLQRSELLRVRILHAYSLRHGFQYNELVLNAFITAYAKCGSLRSARNVFNCIENRTVSSWNALLGGYAQNGDPLMALDIYLQMSSSNLDPDWFSISSLLLACTELRSLRHGKEVHGFLIKKGSVTDPYIFVSLISLYTRCGKLLCAKFLFEGMEDKSLVAWNAMISGYSQNGLPTEAINLFRNFVAGDKKFLESKEIQEIWSSLDVGINEIGYVPETLEVTTS
ncbi:hypothetical protein ACET3Z_015491 [Daucus carota]